MWTRFVGILSAIKGSSTSTMGVNTANLNGTSQYFTSVDTPIFDLTTALTLSCWVKKSPSDPTGAIISKWGGGSTTRAYQLDSQVNEGYQIALSTNGTGSSLILKGPTIASGGWDHVCATWDGSTVKLYVNGAEDATASFTGSLYNATTALYVGANSDGNIKMTGGLASADVYNKALTPSQVTELYNEGKILCRGSRTTALADSSNVASWTLANGGDLVVGQELVDQSGNGNNLTNVGSTPFTGTGLNVEC